MPEHKFRSAEDYRDHLPCDECEPKKSLWCDCHGRTMCPGTVEPVYLKDPPVSPTVEETKKKIQNLHRIDEALALVRDEVARAMAKFPPFNSAHEGWAVLMEEVDELWEEVRAKQGERHLDDMKTEAIQSAAMAIRFILDICTVEKIQK